MKIIDYLTAKPSRFFLLAALIWGGLMYYLNYKDQVNFHPHDLLVEATGMVFDLFVFGVLFSLYEDLREKKGRIDRLNEELSDYKHWEGKEATYRISGIIKRLNSMGVTCVDLSWCFLKKAKLPNIRLLKSYMAHSNLNYADLSYSNLSYVNLSFAKLIGSKLYKTNLIYADLTCADLSNANIREANIREAKLFMSKLCGASLEHANFQSADLRQSDLSDAKLYYADLSEANLWRANLSNAKLRFTKLLNANLEHANLDGAFVGDKSWFEKIEKFEARGIGNIREKYMIDDEGILHLK